MSRSQGSSASPRAGFQFERVHMMLVDVRECDAIASLGDNMSKMLIQGVVTAECIHPSWSLYWY